MASILPGELIRELRKRDLHIITSFHHSRHIFNYFTPGFRNGATAGLNKAWDTADLQNGDLYGYPLMKDRTLAHDRWLIKLKEVIDNYRPDQIWFDFGLGSIPENYKQKMAAYFYNQDKKWGKELIITRKNDNLHPGIGVVDIERGRIKGMGQELWQTDDSTAYNSWLWVKDLKVKPPTEMVHELIDIVSKNGVLLLNVCPKADGMISTDLQRALKTSGCQLVKQQGGLDIVFTQFEAGMGPQSFRIQKEGQRRIRIFGDSMGAMYGGLELAEMICLRGGLHAVEEKARKPYVLRRGLKFNIPFDGRTPSYDDTGTAAQENIATMWDFTYWKHFLDTMVRNRYNVLSLWTTNPYAGMVKLPKYPGVNFDDVGRVTQRLTPKFHNHFQAYDVFGSANHTIIKKICLDDKIAYWTRAFDYAESLGIEIYMFHWNIFLWNADGKHGITYDQDNLKTIVYMRYVVKRMLETYPQIDGIGVSTGENVKRKHPWKIGIEDWLYETYGFGVLDTLKENPERRLRFIFRHLWSDLSKSAKAFEGYDVPFNTSHKYARARLYSTTTSPTQSRTGRPMPKPPRRNTNRNSYHVHTIWIGRRY